MAYFRWDRSESPWWTLLDSGADSNFINLTWPFIKVWCLNLMLLKWISWSGLSLFLCGFVYFYVEYNNRILYGLVEFVNFSPITPSICHFFEGRFSEDGLLNRTKRAFHDPNFLPFQVAWKRRSIFFRH